MKKKVLLIGWDAADWKIIDKLFAEGKLPNLYNLVKRGVRTQLQTLDPPLSPMLWTSIATGFRADIHGIGGFIEPTPSGDGLRPVTSTSRKVKAIWNILQQNGLKSNVVAWWPSNPVEPISGVMVSNLFQVANKPLHETWEFPTGTIHPSSFEES
jgi:predicted AlkP superfamily phosphohydrolase/phosphomutase